jgi:hypothetical protein
MSPSPLRSTPSGNGHGTLTRRAILVGLIACASYSGSAYAAYYGYPFNMLTGAEVIDMLSGGTGAPGDDRQRDYAHSYVAGIKDGTEGRLWCFTGKQKPDELTAEIARALREKHSKLVLKGNAGPLIVEELRLRYPCKTRQEARPLNGPAAGVHSNHMNHHSRSRSHS